MPVEVIPHEHGGYTFRAGTYTSMFRYGSEAEALEYGRNWAAWYEAHEDILR